MKPSSPLSPVGIAQRRAAAAHGILRLDNGASRDDERKAPDRHYFLSSFFGTSGFDASGLEASAFVVSGPFESDL
jgi:hypothetical protein